MSVEQQTTITCDAWGGCLVRRTVLRGLVDARTLAADAGWRNQLVYIGIERRPVWRDYCPGHVGEILGSKPTDPNLECPACGFDPMAPHNGRGSCSTDPSTTKRTHP